MPVTITATQKEALPPSGFFHLIDENAIEIGEWKNGVLHTRIPDAAVNAKGYRLTWTNIVRATADGILAHYERYVHGSDGAGRLFELLPHGGTAGVDEVVVYWGGRPSVRRTSAKAYRAEGFFLRATASDFQQGTAAAARLTEDGSAFVTEADAVRTDEGDLSAPRA